MKSFQFIDALERGEPQNLILYGTSLSYHLAPILRDAMRPHFGDKFSLINAGLSGKASRSGMAHLEERVLKHPFDALLLEFAVNDAFLFDDYPDDTLDKGITEMESRSNLEAMIERVQAARPRCEIVLQTMNPAYDSAQNSNRSGSRRPHLAAFYEGYRSVAMARGLKLIDHTAMWENLRRENADSFEALIPDGVHPTPAAIRSVVAPFMLRQLGVEN